MKKTILVTLIILLIPLIVVNEVSKENKFEIIKNSYVRVKVNNKILKLQLEEYVEGVVAGEMPASFEIEALKAQAVAARTYVLKKIDKNKEYDLDNTTNNQVYLTDEELKTKWNNDYDKYINKIRFAVKSTEGEYLTYNDKIITAFFFSSSNGKTENCEEVFQEKLPYLKSVESSWDKESPSYNGEIKISLKDFYEKLNINYNEILNINIKERTESGNIKTIIINGKEFKSTDIRNKLGLRSTDFNITLDKDIITIKTKGFGHGVGMSQYGANGMAKEGYKYDDILKHYYTNIKIKKI